MDEKTAELRDIFIDTTGSETVTENQEETRGSLSHDRGDVTERVLELIGTMRERYEFESGLDDEALLGVVRGYYDGDSDAELAAALGVDEGVAVRARMDLHLVRAEDREAPFDLEELRALVADGVDLETCARDLDSDVETVGRYRAVVETETEATRANDRFRDEFEELLTDAELSERFASGARKDGLEEATEDLETDVFF
ncbi:MAG: conditioned medium-induced protein 4 [Salinigranum sp.]